MMASGIEMTVEFPELAELRKAFTDLPKNIARKHMGSALRKTLKPGLTALRGNVSKGPTGNLARSIKDKVKTYRSGAAVGMVGFVAAGSGKSKSAAGGSVKKGKDRAYHAGFLEFGTKERTIKSSSRRSGASVASSFRSLGAFKIAKVATRGKFAGAVRVNTSPKYPKAFFKKAARGAVLSVGSMPIGGKKGQAPVKTAYRESLSQMKSLLAVEMTKSLNSALAEMAGPFRRGG
jgi:hypothetical protein